MTIGTHCAMLFSGKKLGGTENASVIKRPGQKLHRFFLPLSFFLSLFSQNSSCKLLLITTMTTPTGAVEGAAASQRLPSYLFSEPTSPMSITPPASPSTSEFNRRHSSGTQYSYRACPICEEKLLVRIDGSLVHKWINSHFSVSFTH